MRTIITIAAAVLLLTISGTTCVAAADYLPEEDPDYGYLFDPGMLINRPVNLQGLTGLIMTNSAYTQPKGSITIGVASIAEDSDDPNFSIIRGITTITAGLTDSLEASLRANAFAINLGSSKTREEGFGDIDLMLKWRLTEQTDLLPAIALGFSYTAPTGDEQKGFRGVEDQSLRLMVIGTSESEIPENIVLGMYFEGQLVYNDRLPWEDADYQSDKFGVVNAGLLVPITKSRELQAILEYNTVVKKNFPSVYEEDHQAVMPALRFVTENLNISMGVQLYRRTDGDSSKTNRYLGTLNYRF